jgi:hypothetical protein
MKSYSVARGDLHKVRRNILSNPALIRSCRRSRDSVAVCQTTSGAARLIKILEPAARTSDLPTLDQYFTLHLSLQSDVVQSVRLLCTAMRSSAYRPWTRNEQTFLIHHKRQDLFLAPQQWKKFLRLPISEADPEQELRICALRRWC